MRDASSARLIMKLIRDSIAAQCTTEGVLLDQQGRIELEESIEATQRNRSFGPSAYCLTADFIKHCHVLASPKTKYAARYLDKGVSDSVLEPLKHVLGMY